MCINLIRRGLGEFFVGGGVGELVLDEIILLHPNFLTRVGESLAMRQLRHSRGAWLKRRRRVHS
jgi:hypothetical protein